MSGRDFVREIPVDLPEAQGQHDVLATLWARTRIDDLMSQDYAGLQRNNAHADVKETITQLGLEYRLMTQFTSFVAVEEMTVTDGGKPRRIDVPVEMPEGMSYEGVFGRDRGNLPVNGRSYVGFNYGKQELRVVTTNSGTNTARARRPASTRQVGSGRSSNMGGGNGTGTAGKLPAPAPVAAEIAANEAPPPKLTPAEEKRQQLQTKLNPMLVALVDRQKDKNAKPGPDEAKFVHDGKAEIQIWLTEKSDETIAELKKLGFEVVLDPRTAKMVIGRVPVEKLEALAELKFVRYVAPQMSGN